MSATPYVPVTADHAWLPSTGRPGPVDYAAASKAANTWRAYRSDRPQWTAWGAAHYLDPWHARPEDVAQWVSDLAARYKPSSIGRKGRSPVRPTQDGRQAFAYPRRSGTCRTRWDPAGTRGTGQAGSAADW